MEIPGLKQLSRSELLPVSKDLQIRLIPQSELQDAWALAVPFLERGQEVWQEYFDLTDFYIELYSERMQLWLVGEQGNLFGCFITEIRKYPKCKVFEFVYAGGEKDNLNKLMAGELFHEVMIYWAVTQGVNYAKIDAGRPGWERVLGRFGYERRGVNLRKKLEKVWRN